MGRFLMNYSVAAPCIYALLSTKQNQFKDMTDMEYGFMEIRHSCLLRLLPGVLHLDLVPQSLTYLWPHRGIDTYSFKFIYLLFQRAVQCEFCPWIMQNRRTTSKFCAWLNVLIGRLKGVGINLDEPKSNAGNDLVLRNSLPRDRHSIKSLRI